jgi:hypothetical protein
MKKSSLFLPLVSFLLSCATTALAPPPDWAKDLDAEYPQDRYIAQTGNGVDRRDAENSALAAISRYFISEVQNSFTGAELTPQQDGVHLCGIEDLAETISGPEIVALGIAQCGAQEKDFFELVRFGLRRIIQSPE